MVELGLNAIKDTVIQVAEAIATVLHVDVTIIDKQKRRIAATGKYRDRVDKYIATDSIFTKVLEEESTLFFTDRQSSLYCAECSAKKDCADLAHLCCPIKVEGETVGLISLIAFSEKQRQVLVANQGNYLNFLFKMASLLASKLKEERAREKLSVQKEQLEAIINSVSEGLLAVNGTGRISFCNKNAADMLDKEMESLVGKDIKKVLPSFNLKLPKNTQTIMIPRRGARVFMLVSSIPIVTDGQSKGAVLTLRSIREVYEMAGQVSFNNNNFSFDQIIGKSEKLKHTVEIARKAALQDSTILIQGESGTGKELFARAIHRESRRKDKPLIAINCGAIPENLLESELFGYEEGAFTGTRPGGKPGKLELAHEGTVFLDEIGDMPLPLQVKLLRFLQDGRIEPLGGTRSKLVNVRVIAATNKNLEKLMEEGKFREDLYYRLSVVPLEIPPLRERREDIDLLIDYFLNRFSQLYESKPFSISPSAREIFYKYDWPGNIRELENSLEYAVNMVKGTYIDVEDLPPRIRKQSTSKKIVPEETELIPLEEMEKRLLQLAWEKYGRYKDATLLIAEQLKISRASVYRKLKKYNIS